jgi:hypothetical protein
MSALGAISKKCHQKVEMEDGENFLQHCCSDAQIVALIDLHQ